MRKCSSNTIKLVYRYRYSLQYRYKISAKLHLEAYTSKTAEKYHYLQLGVSVFYMSRCLPSRNAHGSRELSLVIHYRSRSRHNLHEPIAWLHLSVATSSSYCQVNGVLILIKKDNRQRRIVWMKPPVISAFFMRTSGQ